MSAKTLMRRGALALGLFLIPPMAGSVQTPLVNEDIDLFLAGSGNAGCGCANVLIILDNGSYWSNTYTQPDGANTTKIDMEKAALAAVIPQLSSSIRLGVMMGGQTGADSQYPNPNSNSKVAGGVIRYAMRPMNTTNRASLLTFLNGLDKNSDKASSDPSYAKMMHTSYEYFGGKSLFRATPWFLPGSQPAGLCSGNQCNKYITTSAGSLFYPPYPSSAVGTSPNNDATLADPSPGGQVRTDAGKLRYGSGQNLNVGDTGAFASGVWPHRYASPLTSNCQGTYILFFSNGYTNFSENNGTAGTPTEFSANDLLWYDGGDRTTIPLVADAIDPTQLYSDGANGSESSRLDEYARFLYGTDVNSSISGKQNVITHVLNPWPQSPIKNDWNMEILLQSAAAQGHGRYVRTTSLQDMVNALNQIFSEVIAADSTYAAATVPISANVRGTNVSQIYLGMFRPDSALKARWFGNLKEYTLSVNPASETLFLADATGMDAVNPATGFITQSARSFWTSASNFWSFRTPLENGVGGVSDSPDGQLVEKGAAAQQLRTTYATSQAARKLYTCTGSCGSGSLLSATPFSTLNSSITPLSLGLGVLDILGATGITNWLRGTDLQDENANGSLTDIRASVHGDVLHSYPAFVNYNRNNDDNDIYLFYGSNDGVFRAVKGAFASGAGQEAWGFIPSEFFDKLGILKNNTITLGLSVKKPYFFDGPVTAYPVDVNNDRKIVAADGDKAYIYMPARRGGRLIYALDVSDPLNPKHLWKVTNASTGYSQLAQTWSTVKIARIKGHSNPVAIFGGGYDATAEDTDPAGTDTIGRAIFVADAYTGALLWQAGPSPVGAGVNKTVSGMTYSIPSEIAAYDSDKDGYVDRLYVGDTGGNLWRADIDNASLSNWTVTKLASLAGGGAADKRKFLYPPDVVYNAQGQFDAVLIGSGDREHVFNTTVVNRFYMFKDTHAKQLPVGFTSVTESNLYDASNNLIQSGTADEQAVAYAALVAARGWFVTFPGAGEKSVGGSTSLAGITIFNTHQPTPTDPSSCVANLGTANQYYVSYLDATATVDLTADGDVDIQDRVQMLVGGGLVPTPVPVSLQSGSGRIIEGIASGTHIYSFPIDIGARPRSYWEKRIDP